MEASMYLRALATAIFAGAVLGSVSVIAAPLGQPTASVPQAPIGHLQPRARQFSPRAPDEQMEQQQMSTFDAEQQKLDRQLDKSLNICRC
jgi:hypothetical protein